MNSTPDTKLDPTLARIAADPTYQTLKRKRNQLGWTLTILMLVAY